MGLPRWLSGKESTCQWRRCRRHRFNIWVRKIPWRRKWQPTPVFLPGKIPWTGLQSMGSQESDMTEQLNMHVLGTQHIKVSISGPGPVRTHSLPQCKLKYSLINAIIEIQPTYMGCAINFPMGLSSGGDICICFFKLNPQFSSVQLLSPVWLCDPMNRSTPGLPVHHQLPEFTQTHVHRVGVAIQPSHPLSSPSPPAPNPS